MKIQEAIEILKNERPGCGEKVIYTENEKCESYDMAISALEKQIPKKPIVISNILYNHYKCPRCNDYICIGEPQCLKCEQVLDWSV